MILQSSSGTSSKAQILPLFKDISTLFSINLYREGVWATDFTNDGKILLSASPDKSILLWDLKKAKPTSTLK
jgi:WD40 repeat protein